MKILVTIKRTPHRDVRMKVAPDGALSLDDVKFEINPFDENALEEALRIKESTGAEVVAVTVGDESAHEQLLAALAMGADRAIRVDSTARLDSLQLAKCLAAISRTESPDLILAGKLAVDDENGQVPPMLAQLLDWPQASQAAKVTLLEGGGRVRVACEVDAGVEEVELDLPAVITADLRLNEPRYASVVGIMKARKKPMSVVPIEQIGDLGATRCEVMSYRPLPPKPAGLKVPSVEALVTALRETKLI